MSNHRCPDAEGAKCRHHFMRIRSIALLNLSGKVSFCQAFHEVRGRALGCLGPLISLHHSSAPLMVHRGKGIFRCGRFASTCMARPYSWPLRHRSYLHTLPDTRDSRVIQAVVPCLYGRSNRLSVRPKSRWKLSGALWLPRGHISTKMP